MTEWQDISTAPRDGTRVILYRTRTQGHRAPAREVVIGAFSSAAKLWRVENSHPGWILQDKITHWQPLPNPRDPT